MGKRLEEEEKGRGRGRCEEEEQEEEEEEEEEEIFYKSQSAWSISPFLLLVFKSKHAFLFSLFTALY